MKKFLFLIVVFYLFINISKAHGHDHDHDHDHGDHVDIPEELQHITCGSYIKLKNKATGSRLHSHSVTYGSGNSIQNQKIKKIETKF